MKVVSSIGKMIFLGTMLVTMRSMACEVRLKHRINYSCPAVAYSLDDCEKTSWGGAGVSVTSPAAIHVMTTGYSFYCPSHEPCIQMKDLTFTGCTMTHVPRKSGESLEYASHIFVGDKAWSKRIK
jgi:hypothetical protein